MSVVGGNLRKLGQKLKTFKTHVPARLDRLPWVKFHWMILFALGITWILDGLEVTLMGAVSGILEDPAFLHLSSGEIGLIASFYVAGAVLGSSVFGYLTDRLGRKLLFFVTLAVYLVGVLLTAFSWNVWSFAVFRFLTGAGIGGEYAVINSAIDEFIPASVRGKVDLIINGTYWLGAALGSLSTIIILNPKYFHVDLGWRLGFGVGGLLGLAILLLRKFVPESPGWLVLKGRQAEAEEILLKIEGAIEKDTSEKLPAPGRSMIIQPRSHLPLKEVFGTLFGKYRQRSILGLSLRVSQAFLYNAIFFTYALVLTTLKKM